jgi:hypothetical protein
MAQQAQRWCRICLTVENNVEFSPILDPEKKFAAELYYVSQINVSFDFLNLKLCKIK